MGSSDGSCISVGSGACNPLVMEVLLGPDRLDQSFHVQDDIVISLGHAWDVSTLEIWPDVSWQCLVTQLPEWWILSLSRFIPLFYLWPSITLVTMMSLCSAASFLTSSIDCFPLPGGVAIRNTILTFPFLVCSLVLCLQESLHSWNLQRINLMKMNLISNDDAIYLDSVEDETNISSSVSSGHPWGGSTVNLTFSCMHNSLQASLLQAA